MKEKIVTVLVFFIGAAACLSLPFRQMLKGGQKVADRFWSSAPATGIVFLFFFFTSIKFVGQATSTLDARESSLYFGFALMSLAVTFFVLAVLLKLIHQPKQAARTNRHSNNV